MVTREKLAKINEMLNTNKFEIKRKDKYGKIITKPYSLVNDRVKAFRDMCPDGTIEAEILSMEDGICLVKATVKDEAGKVLATGHAFEKETANLINKTSYVEVAETSAIGRALGFLSVGIDESIASADEMTNAIINQEQENEIGEEEFNEIETLIKATGVDKDKLLAQYKLESFITLDKKRYRVLRDKLIKALKEQVETDK